MYVRQKKPQPTLIAAMRNRKGNIVVLSAGILVMILGFAAFTIDVGFIALSKAQLQGAVDSAVLAAAMEFDQTGDQDEVMLKAGEAAVELAAMHTAGNHEPVFIDPSADILFGRRTWNGEGYDYAWGSDAVPYNMVKVTARRKEVISEIGGAESVSDRRLKLFFAPIIGHETVDLEVSAVATYQARDIVLVLDYSASMNDDSELSSINQLGQTAVVANIQQMWEDLGSPTYGNMGFEPDWVTVQGDDASVKWMTDEVYVQKTSGYNLQYVKLYFANGNNSTYSVSGNSGTFSGSGSNNNQRITKVKVRVDGDWDTIDFYDNYTIRKGLGLHNVSYPYPSGSWDDYIEYARSHSGSMPWYDSYVYSAGYRRKFGMLTLINFWNKNKPRYDQTPDLWKASQQPITALKNAVDLLLDYLSEVESEDNVGLTVYTYPQEDGAKLESGLINDYSILKTISRERQAGHYDNYTNIGAGMRRARWELEENARGNAFRMMVLMTDGLANRSSTGASPTNFALNEADLAADSGIKIMTISLGLGADTWLMQEIADRTGGEHFNVPGGSTVAEYEDELKEVFHEIASDRPLKLIVEQ